VPATDRRRALALCTVAVVAVTLGYADLARGGLSLGPVLLIASYFILIPIAILRS
jgi:hypothetical protein